VFAQALLVGVEREHAALGIAKARVEAGGEVRDIPRAAKRDTAASLAYTVSPTAVNWSSKEGGGGREREREKAATTK
jgi:hypothetical protein